jgi:broad specificity phosphatase PhoE
MQGQLDSDLTELGRAQAEINARMLARADIEALFCSPLGRARTSAEIINQYLALPIRSDPRIKEWNCGDWSGRAFEEVATRWAVEWAAYEADRYYYRGPHCENYPDMIGRVSPFLTELLAHPARNVAVVSHGLIGRIMVGTLLDFDVTTMLSFHQPNAVVYRVTIEHEKRSLDHFVAGVGPMPGIVPRD